LNIVTSVAENISQVVQASEVSSSQFFRHIQFTLTTDHCKFQCKKGQRNTRAEVQYFFAYNWQPSRYFGRPLQECSIMLRSNEEMSMPGYLLTVPDRFGGVGAVRRLVVV
jgi:hypothetical protein